VVRKPRTGSLAFDRASLYNIAMRLEERT